MMDTARLTSTRDTRDTMLSMLAHPLQAGETLAQDIGDADQAGDPALARVFYAMRAEDRTRAVRVTA